jgi:co-chaperonin GroES (HSP10)
LPDVVSVGDRLYCPDNDTGLRRSGLYWHCEFYIEESVPYGILNKECTMIKPIGNRLLVKPLHCDEQKKEMLATTTSGGVAIPDKARRDVIYAEVVERGTGIKSKGGQTIFAQVKKGDRVILPYRSSKDMVNYTKHSVQIGDNTYWLIRDTDLDAIDVTGLS